MFKISFLSALLISIGMLSSAAESPAAGQAAEATWWHRSEIVNALDLSPALLKKMDDVLQTNIGQRLELRSDFRTASKAFREALIAANRQKAEAAAERLADIAASRDRLSSRLKIDILSLLSREQLARLTVDYPKVIRGSWIRHTHGHRGKRAGKGHFRKQ